MGCTYIPSWHQWVDVLIEKYVVLDLFYFLLKGKNKKLGIMFYI